MKKKSKEVELDNGDDADPSDKVGSLSALN